MQILKQINLWLLVVLGIVAGAAKVLQLPKEMEFLHEAGLNTTLILVFGLLQGLGGILLVFTQLRVWGAVITLAALVLSTFLLFRVGKTGFAMFSLIPVLMTVFVIADRLSNRRRIV